jgi:two-component system, chemotaxis family, CheB/CheR fusion protein
LAQQQLAAYAPQKADRLRIAGERVLLPADIATPFGLVLHELGVNATKYGALSTAAGKVGVSWSVGPGNPRTLHFAWKETGGPAVKPSGPAGFGSTLIESAIPHGHVKREFRGDGVLCTIEVPLSQPIQNGSHRGT